MAIALYWSRFRPGLSQIFRVVGYGYFYCSILVAYCVMCSGALDSSHLFLSYPFISLASPMTCQYTNTYSQTLNHTYLHIYTYIGVSAFEFADEVAIKSTTLSNKKKTILDLSNKVEELTLNNEHQLRLKEMDFNDRNGDISKKFELQVWERKREWS